MVGDDGPQMAGKRECVVSCGPYCFLGALSWSIELHPTDEMQWSSLCMRLAGLTISEQTKKASVGRHEAHEDSHIVSPCAFFMSVAVAGTWEWEWDRRQSNGGSMALGGRYRIRRQLSVLQPCMCNVYTAPLPPCRSRSLCAVHPDIPGNVLSLLSHDSHTTSALCLLSSPVPSPRVDK